MTKVEISFIGQPEVGQTNALDFLVTHLDDSQTKNFTAATAWVHTAGVKLLSPALARFRARGGRATLICGLSRGGATVDGLTEALDSFDEVFVVFDPSGRTIHAKMYLLTGATRAALMVGSQNLSASGLVTNHEASLTFVGDPLADVIRDADKYLNALISDRDIARVLDNRILDDLIESDQIWFATPPNTEDRQTWTKNPRLRIFDASSRAFRGASVPRRQQSISPPSLGSGVPSPFPGRTVVARWSKTLPPADAQRLVGSNVSNTMTLTRSGHPIDKTTWFREVLFRGAAWSTVPHSPDHERAAIVFEVDGLGPTFREEMFVEHNLRHGSSQNNRVSSIRWGQETRLILRNGLDLTDKVATVERFADQTFRISFGENPNGPFLTY